MEEQMNHKLIEVNSKQEVEQEINQIECRIKGYFIEQFNELKNIIKSSEEYNESRIDELHKRGTQFKDEINMILDQHQKSMDGLDVTTYQSIVNELQYLKYKQILNERSNRMVLESKAIRVIDDL